MSIELKIEYQKLRRNYRGYFIEDFDEDYSNYRAVLRVINSYFKNPTPRKAHDIYNRIIMLHRVFNKRFINRELINNCDTHNKQLFLKYILNELFKHYYTIELKYEYEWKKDVDFLKNCGIICRK